MTDTLPNRLAHRYNKTSMEKRILNLGCGKDTSRTDDFIHVDIIPFNGVDVVADLDSYPWPFRSCTFSVIMASDIFEHLDDVVAAMNECHRLLIPRGVLRIKGPAWNSLHAWTDVTHKRAFTIHSFNHFDPSTKLGKRFDYGDGKWKILDVQRQKDGNIIFDLRRLEQWRNY